MEHGDIVEYNSECYIVLRVENDMMYCMAYDFTFDWILIDECRKVGSSDAIYKVMYEIKSFELKENKND